MRLFFFVISGDRDYIMESIMNWMGGGIYHWLGRLWKGKLQLSLCTISFSHNFLNSLLPRNRNTLVHKVIGDMVK